MLLDRIDDSPISYDVEVLPKTLHAPAKDEDRPMPRGKQRRPAEQRKHLRFPMKATAIFTWEISEGGPFRGEGVTRDISVKGAYIFSTICPPANATVHIEIHLFSHTPSILITAKMRTQRVDPALPGKEGGGFSVVGKDFVSRQLLGVPPSIQ